jgi:hypothetical protein
MTDGRGRPEREGSAGTEFRRSPRHGEVGTGALTALLLCACQTEIRPCDPNLHAGQDQVVTVLGPYNPGFDGPSFSCGGAFVTPGAELVIRPLRLLDTPDCRPYHGTFVSFGSFTYTDGSPLLQSGDINYSGTLSKDGCSGYVHGVIGDATPSSGGPPRYGFTFSFEVASGVSPEACGLSTSSCYDEFAAHLSPKAD